jgi:hypothetical protein
MLRLSTSVQNAAVPNLRIHWNKKEVEPAAGKNFNYASFERELKERQNERLVVGLQGKATEQIIFNVNGGFDMGRVPSISGRSSSKFSLGNGKMQYSISALDEGETRRYNVFLRAKKGEKILADLDRMNLEGLYLVLEKSEEIIDLSEGSAVLDRDIKEEGFLLLTRNPDFDPENVPFTIQLGQNYPNPFNGTTSISIAIPYSAEGKQVKIEVFNILGQRITTLLNEKVPAGWHIYQWNGTNNFGTTVASGIYFYRMIIGDKIITKKSIFMK